MSYRPAFRRQFGDPTTSLDPFLCTMESGAMALDFHTKGAISVWGGELVPWCGLTPAQIAGQAPRQDGTLRTGTNLVNVGLAWAHFHQQLDNRTGQGWDQVLAALAEGRAVILQGDYDQFSLATRCQDSFTGNHAVIVLPETSGTKRLTGDPLCSAFAWVEEYELYRYADKLGINGKLYFAVTGPLSDAGPGLPPTDTEEPADMGVIATNPRRTTVRQVTGIPDGAYRRCFNVKGELWPVPTDVREVFCLVDINPPFTAKGLGNEAVTFSGEMFQISGNEVTYAYPRDVNLVSEDTGAVNEVAAYNEGVRAVKKAANDVPEKV